MALLENIISLCGKNEEISIEKFSNMPSPNLVCEVIDQPEECYIENDQAGTYKIKY